MKPESRVLGVDDGPFTWDDARVPVVGVAMRGGTYVEGVLVAEVTVDGTDATEVLLSAVGRSRHARGLAAVMLDGVALGGFNVVDLAALANGLGVPVISVTRGVPDLSAMEAALVKHHADGARRMALVRSVPTRVVRTEGSPITVGAVGCTLDEAVDVVARSTVRGLTPEPLRLAHLVASAIARGESAGQ